MYFNLSKKNIISELSNLYDIYAILLPKTSRGKKEKFYEKEKIKILRLILKIRKKMLALLLFFIF